MVRNIVAIFNLYLDVYFYTCMKPKIFDVIIIGGSYSGLSAAMALGRAIRTILIVDSGTPCNLRTPYAHNFITRDGEKPANIARKAKEQVLNYPTTQFLKDEVLRAKKSASGFELLTGHGITLNTKKLLFTTGIRDIIPSIDGFSSCWGISILHCPYCHGYEVKDKKIGLLGHGKTGFELSRVLYSWSKDMVLFTNGESHLTKEQAWLLKKKNIPVIEQKFLSIEHLNGQIQFIRFTDGTTYQIDALFTKLPFEQQCNIPQQLGVELTEQGFIKIDDFQRTNVTGIYAAGDNTTVFRAVSVATAAGTKAGSFINRELIEEEF